jgi:hypothetical protein
MFSRISATKYHCFQTSGCRPCAIEIIKVSKESWDELTYSTTHVEDKKYLNMKVENVKWDRHVNVRIITLLKFTLGKEIAYVGEMNWSGFRLCPMVLCVCDEASSSFITGVYFWYICFKSQPGYREILMMFSHPVHLSTWRVPSDMPRLSPSESFPTHCSCPCHFLLYNLTVTDTPVG